MPLGHILGSCGVVAVPELARVVRLATSAGKCFTGEMESREYARVEPGSFAGIASRSAFGEAKRAHGRKEPEPSPYGPENSVRPEKRPKWPF